MEKIIFSVEDIEVIQDPIKQFSKIKLKIARAGDNLHHLPIADNALDMAAINLTSSSTAEPEADGDRTVHPAMDRVPATELLRRVTALERLVNDTTAYLVNPSGSKISELARSRDRWLKSRAGEWVS